MFNFFGMADNYNRRKIGRDEFLWGFISTCSVSDGSKPYETAVQSDEYAPADDPEDTDSMVIVESYDTAEQAKKGHAKWVKLMTTSPPKELKDCYNSGVGQMFDACGGDATQVRVEPFKKPKAKKSTKSGERK